MPTVSVTRTYLALESPSALRGSPLPDDGRLERVAPCPAAFYRFLYREVGRRYQWRDRLDWTESQIRTWLDDPANSLYVLYVGGAPAGYFELRIGEAGAVEIVYFGLLPGYLGRGLGKGLLTAAVQTAWQAGASRVWLHTCTLDDPAALPNYLKRGFTRFKEEQYTVELPA
ncbi:MAG: GNAT family N-acetyltransferase [Gemmatimonadales bacterium]